MESWQKNRLHKLELNEEGRALFGEIVRSANALGFDYCNMGLRAPFPISNPIIRIASNSPEYWQQEYFNKGYISIDPVVKHAYYSLEWMIWSDEIYAGVPDFWKAKQAAGLRYGLSLPTRGIHAKGVLSISRPEKEITATELEEKKLHLSWLAQTAHTSMEAHLLPELSAIQKIVLTDREIDILRMLAEGKTSEDIAGILQITKRTIDFHINNAVTKLGVENRTAATVLLAVLGLL